MICYSISTPLRGELYEKTIDCLIQECDSYIFNLPNMEKVWVNERNRKHMKGFPLGYTEIVDPNEHEKYLAITKKYTDIIQPDIIKRKRDTGYLNQCSSNEIEIFHVRVSHRTKKLFMQFNSFSDWIYPDAPEDPCFLSQGKCVFQCISHEGLQYLFSKNRVLLDLFKKNKAEVFSMPCGKTPRLDV